jgi:hypothetical protein
MLGCAANQQQYSPEMTGFPAPTERHCCGDKFAASRGKGMWMGGTIPLGYDVEDRKLVTNADEADRVRVIFAGPARSQSGRPAQVAAGDRVSSHRVDFRRPRQPHRPARDIIPPLGWSSGGRDRGSRRMRRPRTSRGLHRKR